MKRYNITYNDATYTIDKVEIERVIEHLFLQTCREVNTSRDDSMITKRSMEKALKEIDNK